MEMICSDARLCTMGCFEDGDCLAGRLCSEDGMCLEANCRSSQLDCQTGERCIDGACTMISPSPCSSCSYQDWVEGLGEERECVIVSYDTSFLCDWNEDIGCPNTMSCYPADGVGETEEGVCIQSYAFYRCEEEEDCPRGFHCAQDIYANESGINVCWGECSFFLSQGWL